MEGSARESCAHRGSVTAAHIKEVNAEKQRGEQRGDEGNAVLREQTTV